MRATALFVLSLVLTGMGLGSGGVAAAQAIYRCAPNLYSQQPCDGGQRMVSADPRSPEQAAEARAASVGQMKLADRMERERIALERTRPLSGAVAIGPHSLADEPEKHGPKKAGKPASRKASSKSRPADTATKPHKLEGFVAFAPGPVKPKRAAPREKKAQD